MSTPTSTEQWRADLFKLRASRDSMILELSLYAQENGDLRENSGYIHMEQKIQLVDAQIAEILAEFGKHNIEKTKAKHALKKPRKVSKFDF